MGRQQQHPWNTSSASGIPVPIPIPVQFKPIQSNPCPAQSSSKSRSQPQLSVELSASVGHSLIEPEQTQTALPALHTQSSPRLPPPSLRLSPPHPHPQPRHRPLPPWLLFREPSPPPLENRAPLQHAGQGTLLIPVPSHLQQEFSTTLRLLPLLSDTTSHGFTPWARHNSAIST